MAAGCVRNAWCVLGQFHDSDCRRAPEPMVPTTDEVEHPVLKQKPGRKFDTSKLRWDLLPWEATTDVVKVLTHGAAKYEPDNWRRVEGWRWRYHAAAMRHIAAWAMGERDDPEWGIHHLAHAICCLMFIIELDVSPQEKT